MAALQDSPFMSAGEKAKVLRQWETFLKSGLQWKHFTKALYDHLIQHCSFIAHYNQAQFYATYFEHGEGTARFLSQFDMTKAEACGVPKSVEYGMTYWATGDYADINREMIRIAGGYIPGLLGRASLVQEVEDIVCARALLRKHRYNLEISGHKARARKGG